MFEKLFGLAAERKLKVPVRGARAAFMNLAYAKTPTIPGTWATPPVGFANLTDEKHLTHLTTDGVTDTTLSHKVQIKIDLGQIYEVYRIDVMNTVGAGIKANNIANAGTCDLETSVDDSTYTVRATQTPALTTYVDMDVDYEGEGIAVRYVRLYLENDDTYFMTIDISDIEVFGS